jgi:hypothetical protein
LSTQDIPGAVPQRKISKLLPIRGRELEPQLPSQEFPIHHNQSQGPEILTKPRASEKGEDSLDKFAREYNSQSVEPKRNKYEQFLREIELNNKLTAARKESNNQLRSSYAADMALSNHNTNNNLVLTNGISHGYSNQNEDKIPVKNQYQ